MRNVVAVAILLCAIPSVVRADEAADAARAEAAKFHQRVVDLYMHSQWAELETALKDWSKHQIYMTPEARADVGYINTAEKEIRPAWWAQTRSSTPVTFNATIWKKTFKANYMPSGMLGAQGVLGVNEQGVIIVVVTWQPHMVDSPKKAAGELAKSHALTEGDLAEAIVWHELGHNYITRFLPADTVLTLYQKYMLLFSALQEFYADATALYHCGPQGRKALLFTRAPGLEYSEENDPHYRGSYALAALILATVLEDPKSWPSFRLPGKVPAEDVERMTLLYLYNHISPKYTLDEDRRLRELIGKTLWNQGADVLKKKGTLLLPNKQTVMLMTSEDRKFQPKREAWIKEKLQAAIDAKLADAPALASTDRPGGRSYRIIYRPGMAPEVVPIGPGEGPAVGPTSKPAVEPKPVPKPEVKPEPKPEIKPPVKPEPKPVDEETQAGNLMTIARTYIGNDMKVQAKAKLREIIVKYPRTHTATLAKDMLKRMEEEDK